MIKNTTTKKNEKLIKNLLEMINQFAMAGDQFKSWRESWMEVVEQLEKGYDYECVLEGLKKDTIEGVARQIQA